MRKILVTGGAGFIGYHYVDWLLQQYPDYYIVNLDKLTYAANRSLIETWHANTALNYHFIEGDVGDFDLLSALFNTFDFSYVIHLAAETHVDRSIIDPLLFVKTNVEGTSVLLRTAYNHWFDSPGVPRAPFIDHRFLYASTDEVYGSLCKHSSKCTEESNLAPRNPYSASKAAAECLVHSYMHTYGLNGIITRSTNNYGLYQHPEKLIPMALSNAVRGKAILLHGDGSSIRDWLHVVDNCKAIDLVLHKGEPGTCYNIGANEAHTSLEIVLMLCEKLDQISPIEGRSYASLITFVEERAGQDRRYALDCTKIQRTLDWRPKISLQEGLDQLVQRYMQCAYKQG